MISKAELKNIALKTGLALYQQEKDYLLKLFLFFYYKKYEDAVFKGGTCIKYLFGLDRFSEDLDFNLKVSPGKFKEQAENVIKDIENLGIKSRFKKKEIFPEAFACVINFEGPLFVKKGISENTFSIDAGKRTGTFLNPEWQMIKSDYPETTPNFSVLAMSKEEILAEKIASIFAREKGRDLYDAWFLLKAGINLNKELIEKKIKLEKISIDFDKIMSKKDYERDMSKITKRIIPYEQAVNEIKKVLAEAGLGKS